jgi:Zn finger protein HypA/HybF involved in hydrogenase expression
MFYLACHGTRGEKEKSTWKFCTPSNIIIRCTQCDRATHWYEGNTQLAYDKLYVPPCPKCGGKHEVELSESKPGEGEDY